jgi:hypothetical protein
MEKDEKTSTLKIGAGILPFSYSYSHQPLFLFQKIYRGRKKGFLLDFGGKAEKEECIQYDLIRKIEEKNKKLDINENGSFAKEENPDEMQILQEKTSLIYQNKV